MASDGRPLTHDERIELERLRAELDVRSRGDGPAPGHGVWRTIAVLAAVGAAIATVATYVVGVSPSPPGMPEPTGPGLRGMVVLAAAAVPAAATYLLVAGRDGLAARALGAAAVVSVASGLFAAYAALFFGRHGGLHLTAMLALPAVRTGALVVAAAAATVASRRPVWTGGRPVTLAYAAAGVVAVTGLLLPTVQQAPLWPPLASAGSGWLETLVGVTVPVSFALVLVVAGRAPRREGGVVALAAIGPWFVQHTTAVWQLTRMGGVDVAVAGWLTLLALGVLTAYALAWLGSDRHPAPASAPGPAD